MHILQIAETLDTAALHARATEQISASTSISLEEAYSIQAASIARREQRGERVIGIKMGFTSLAKMRQMGVSDTIWGRLTDAMLVEDGGTLSLSRFVHPRVEPEVALLLGRALDGPVTLAQAFDAVEAVAPALEIIDSRYSDFRFSLTDVVADNSSASAFALGPWQRPDFPIENLGMLMTVNGRPVAFGSTASILGNPLRSLVAAVRLTSRAGLRLEKGWVVLAGGATAAEKLVADSHVVLETEKLGRVGFFVRG